MFVGVLFLLVEQPTGREELQPDTSPSQLWFVLKCDHVVQRCEGKQRARKPPLRGVWRVNPKPYWRIVGVVGAGLHADASAREVVRPHA